MTPGQRTEQLTEGQNTRFEEPSSSEDDSLLNRLLTVWERLTPADREQLVANAERLAN